MNILETGLEGLKIIEPKIWGDERGYFFESYSQKTFAEYGIDTVFVQDNEAKSSRGVLRGLHYQAGNAAQAKLVRVSQGKVLDVVADIRPDSITYGKKYTIELSNENKRQLFVPRGFAHGYITLSETAVFQYKCDNFYDKNAEGGIAYDDPQLAIDWMLSPSEFILSEKDQGHPTFGNHKPFL